MRLNKAVLHNICQHEHLTLDFEPGVTGIFGGNGCGKSNMVNMVAASLTGNFGINPGNKEENIRHDAPENARSDIYTEWEHDQLPFAITRSLRPVSQKLVIGNRKVTKANEIASELDALLGVDRHVLEEYVFIAQWKIFEFISADPATRMKNFMRLCQVDKAERIWNLLGAQIKRDQSLGLNVDDTRKELKVRVKEQKQLCVTTSKRLQNVRKDLLDQEARTENDAVITDYLRSQTLTQQQTQLTAELVIRRTELAKASTKADKVHTDLVDARFLVDNELRPTYKSIQQRYETQRETIRIIKRRQQLMSVLETTAPSKPVIPPRYVRSEVLVELIKSLRAQETKTKQRMDLFSREGIVECPTCGTLATELSGDIETWNCELDELAGEIIDKTKAYRVAHDYERIEADYQSAFTKYQQAYDKAKTELDLLSEVDTEFVPVAQDDVDIAHAALTVAEARVKDLVKYDLTFKSEVSRLSGIIEVLSGQAQKVQSELVLLQVTPALYNDALAKITRHEEAVEAAATAKSELAAAERLIEIYQFDINRVTRLLATSNVAKQWIDNLTDWRTVFHREALPRVVTQTVMENMVGQINETLELFNGPFRVTAEDRLTFLAHKPRGYAEEACRLSGGEKVILGLAFRFSVARQIGMMILDEPTAGLDADNIECLVDMLEQMSELARRRGNQIIIITHDNRLERVLDHKIEIRRQ